MENLKKKLRKLMALVGLSASVALAGCSSNKDNNSDASLKEVVEATADSTCFDEVVDKEMLDKAYQLEKYLEISDKFQKMKIYGNGNTLNEAVLLSPEEINKLIDEYLKYQEKRDRIKVYSDSEWEKLEKNLKVQSSLVNNYICTEGYNIMAYVDLVCLKSKLGDVLEIPVKNVLEFEIGDSSSLPYDETKYYFSDYDSYTPVSSSLFKLTTSVYEMQNNGTSPNANSGYSPYQYNPDRNELIWDSISTVKEVILDQYEVNKRGVIKIKK